MLKDVKARDIMNTDVLTIQDDMSAREAADFLINHEISGAPVEDRKGKVVGVVSLTDVALAGTDRVGFASSVSDNPDFYLRGWEDELDPEDFRTLHIEDEGLPVREIMTRSVYSVEEEATLPEVARAMVQAKIHRVLVRRGEEIVGIISTLDLLKAVAEEG